MPKHAKFQRACPIFEFEDVRSVTGVAWLQRIVGFQHLDLSNCSLNRSDSQMIRLGMGQDLANGNRFARKG